MDLFLKIIKWPVGFFSVFLLPAVFLKFVFLLKNSFSLAFSPFVLGMFVYWALWKFFFKNPYAGSAFPVLEHELTHALFALLTFRRIKNISVSWNSGGQVRFSGSGNWLITLSPYFFPLLSIIVILTGSLFSTHTSFVFKFILGITSMYNLISTYREIHPAQTDIQKEGYIYFLLFNPGMFLFFYGIIWSFVLNGFYGVKFFTTSVFNVSLGFFMRFLHLFI